MKRVLCLICLLLSLSVGFGQTAPKSDPGNAFMGWVHDAWKTVQDERKAAADRIVQQSPKRFQNMKAIVAGLTKKVHNSIDTASLEQKRDLLVELWRVRKSLDLMTLCNPDLLEALTGLDTSGLKALEAQATSMCQLVTSKIHRR